MRHVEPILEKSQLAPEHHGVYESIASSRGGIPEMFGVLLHDPAVADRIARLGEQIRFDSQLPASVKEIVILTVAAQMPGSYFWKFHLPLARDSGVSEELIGFIEGGSAATGDDGKILAYVRDVVACRPPAPDIVKALIARFGASGLVSLTSTAAYYVMLISFTAALGLSAGIQRPSG